MNKYIKSKKEPSNKNMKWRKEKKKKRHWICPLYHVYTPTQTHRLQTRKENSSTKNSTQDLSSTHTCILRNKTTFSIETGVVSSSGVVICLVRKRKHFPGETEVKWFGRCRGNREKVEDANFWLLTASSS